MDNRVLVLDANFLPMGIESTAKGIGYILRDKGVSIFDAEDMVTSAHFSMPAPSIVLLKESHAYKRRAKSKALKWTKKNVLRHYNYSCGYCGAKANTVDHIVPKMRGGKNEWLNTVAACFTCNSKKGNKSLESSGMTLRVKVTVPTHMRQRLNVSERQMAWLVDNSLTHILD